MRRKYALASILAIFSTIACGEPDLVYLYASSPKVEAASVNGIVDLVPADTTFGSGCEQRIAELTIDEVVYKGENDDVIGFRAEKPGGDGIEWLYTMNTAKLYEKLPNARRHDVKKLVKKGKEVIVTYQVCGSGGFTSVRDIFAKTAINHP